MTVRIGVACRIMKRPAVVPPADTISRAAAGIV
jgi:hypothetical protein